MKLSRRRFLTISAGMALKPHSAAAASWNGRAFGANISITIKGGVGADSVLQKARQIIEKTERLFSLYDENSPLVQLNRTGQLIDPDPLFLELMTASDDAFKATQGLFDPTVQMLWQIYAKNWKPTEYYNTIGWDRVQFDAQKITLDHHQALTFNGIAQGFATDKVTDLLESYGLSDVLVNIGEHRGIGGPWSLGLYDPEHGQLGTRTLRTGAIATSSPMASNIIPGGHIIHKTRRANWSTVSVESASATVADSLSTAMVLATRDEIDAIRARGDVSRTTLVDRAGDLITL